MAGNIRELCIEDYDIEKLWPDTPFSFDNISSLILKNVKFFECDFGQLFPRLSKVVYIIDESTIAQTSQSGRRLYPSPFCLVHTWQLNAKTLKTLCLHIGPISKAFDRDHRISPDLLVGELCEFEVIEDIWVHLDSCDWAVPADEFDDYLQLSPSPLLPLKGPQYLIPQLPASLRRLHVDGDVGKAIPSMYQLLENRTSGNLPNLKEVAFESADHTRLRRLYKELENTGVRVAEKVDRLTVLW
ncbi:hypothetical protein CTRI78_v007624 [Colletotrichum trifolii]|uniref:F-box domain-containing protein n=1 Tax=Colletotrichum trifolii TaxID=5466 RepID=A0A4R8RE13_COLTR|nr:hypothetical protein CTRI78_v007624 [Colletotrichum trifolii]